ncbi:hypothetical protein [Prauserella cavernicola]|uniref:Uncharacterized protein n=1 Tax=Prauserella cavernicola TaxID=2800127 RepID=A0A934QRU7_9PSEU|nr:hypothetical protein [Prauserella cavernicola]MBK1785117.1 hypothetical protein [Prauserella cavernicola]
MSLHVHGYAIPDRPAVRVMSLQVLRGMCWRGEMPAEALALVDPAEVDQLIYRFWLTGWSDVEIATHTRMSTYTAARIRDRLGLAAHPARKVPA